MAQSLWLFIFLSEMEKSEDSRYNVRFLVNPDFHAASRIRVSLLTKETTIKLSLMLKILQQLFQNSGIRSNPRFARVDAKTFHSDVNGARRNAENFCRLGIVHLLHQNKTEKFHLAVFPALLFLELSEDDAADASMFAHLLP